MHEVIEYIKRYPQEVQDILQKLRETIKEEVPEAGEKISYGVPTFTLYGKYFIYIAAYKNHISVYPAHDDFTELSSYRTGKGTYQFPLNQEIPYELIRKFASFRAKLNT
jgi:uncharacterized protein YdhG (YjbR/CyaY superfamily)